MARTLTFHFDILIPAGTAKTTPLVTPTQFTQSIVDRIEWLFPPGCQGQVGIQIGSRAVPIIPQQPTAFILRSGDSAYYDLQDMHDTGDWSVIGFNTGTHPHTIQVTFFTRKREVVPELDALIPDSDQLLRLGVG